MDKGLPCLTTGVSGKGGNIVETFLKLAREKGELRIASDQVCSPTYSGDLAHKLAGLVETDYYGVFHITNGGACSWYDFATEAVNAAGLPVSVTPISSEEYLQKAWRPRYSVLDNCHLRLLGMDDMRPWQEALNNYMMNKGHVSQAGQGRQIVQGGFQ